MVTLAPESAARDLAEVLDSKIIETGNDWRHTRLCSHIGPRANVTLSQPYYVVAFPLLVLEPGNWLLSRVLGRNEVAQTVNDQTFGAGLWPSFSCAEH
jgi:hypothetical protein